MARAAPIAHKDPGRATHPRAISPTAYRDCVPKGRLSHLEADELPYTGELEADRQADTYRMTRPLKRAR